MSTKQTIISEIKSRVESSKTVNYTSWQIGITNDPTTRKQQHADEKKETKYWKQWLADSLSDAREIESYFIENKNMKGGTGGDLSPHKTVYVYIF